EKMIKKLARWQRRSTFANREIKACCRRGKEIQLAKQATALLAIPVLYSLSQHPLLAVDMKDIPLEAPDLDAKIVSVRR
ncbi:hypothetical protein HispidOSU_024397, partial [Sigmodon hispidus]